MLRCRAATFLRPQPRVETKGTIYISPPRKLGQALINRTAIIKVKHKPAMSAGAAIHMSRCGAAWGPYPAQGQDRWGAYLIRPPKALTAAMSFPRKRETMYKQRAILLNDGPRFRGDNATAVDNFGGWYKSPSQKPPRRWPAAFRKLHISYYSRVSGKRHSHSAQQRSVARISGIERQVRSHIIARPTGMTASVARFFSCVETMCYAVICLS